MDTSYVIHHMPDNKQKFRLVLVEQASSEVVGGVPQIKYTVLEDDLTFDQAASKMESLQ